MEDDTYKLVEKRELWSLQVLTDEEEQTWADYGAHNADWKTILRTLDFCTGNRPDEKFRMVFTEVTVRVADPDWLRLTLKSSGEEAPDVSSE